MSDTDRNLACAEYVLGTLDASERAVFERELAADPRLQAEVVQWEDWLAGLNDLVEEEAPAAGLWSAIERRLRPGPTAAPAPVPASATAPATVSARDAVGMLRRSRARWRAAALGLAAVAAALALFAARGLLQPPPPSYLAVINRGGELPALVVRVDTGTGTVSIRPLAAEVPAGRVLELWYIAGSAAPRPIGLVGTTETRASLPPGSPVDGATLAVSVEPRGGSPTGAPTGQVVYSGKLIPDQ